MKKQTITAVKNAIEKHGLSVENITYIARDARVIPALIINHNYNGLYPTDATYTAARIVATIAKKAGYTAEIRGYYTATLIY